MIEGEMEVTSIRVVFGRERRPCKWLSEENQEVQEVTPEMLIAMIVA